MINLKFGKGSALVSWLCQKQKQIYKLKRNRFLRLISLITLFILIICLSFLVALQLFIYLNY